ncbi:hypothetical protein [Actinoplanes sp. NPDC049265]|uniref:hypothetical protein n=1 Tax=Actinoplanes sp. NPDC049265 TaxID=3363902 RepID=UPI00371A285C
MSTVVLIPRPSLPRAMAESFLSPRRHSGTRRWLHYLPMVLILGVQAGLTLRLHNIANADEALYIDAGHAYLAQWAGGPAAPDYGGYFSGFPLAYPIFAAVVDGLGGLAAVRFTSLILMMIAVYAAGAIAARLAPAGRSWGARLAGMAFAALSGPTLFAGHLATFDAACAAAVIGAAALAVTRTGAGSAALAGLVAGVGAIVKYTGAPFVAVAVVLAVLSGPTLRRGLARASLLAVTAAGAMLAVYLPNAGWITTGIRFTTTNRAAHNYRDLSFLGREFLLGMGLLAALAVVGLVLSRRRDLLIGVALLGAGVAIPLSQARLHEYTSYNKHLVFVALFFAPVAALILRLRAPLLRPVVLAAALYLLAVTAMYRADFMFHEWPDSTPVIARVERENRPGLYIGVGADSMAYYAKDHPQLRWTEPWALYGAGPDQMRAEVAAGKYAGIILTSGETGSADLDARTALMMRLVRDNPRYELAGTWPKHRYDTNRFYLYLRRD